jgi:hypothetical protein
MNTLNKDWLAGFIDGDGSFAIDKVGNFYRPSLSIATFNNVAFTRRSEIVV